MSGSWEYQPGALLDWGNLFFYGDLDDIKLDNPTRDRWFNTDAGFEKDPAKTPAAFQKRTFPFRVDGVRGQTSRSRTCRSSATSTSAAAARCSSGWTRRTCSTGSSGRARI